MGNYTLKFTTAYRYYHLRRTKTEEKRKVHFLETLKKVLEQKIPEDLRVSIRNLELLFDNHIEIQLKGKDKDELVFAKSLLEELVGSTIKAKDLSKGKKLRGFLSEPHQVGFGLFAYAGIIEPEKEILIPLFHLRKALLNDQKVPLSEIVKNLGFMENLPVDVVINKITYDKGGIPKIECYLTEEYLEMYKNWMQGSHDIIFTTGMPRQAIKKVIARRGHTIDIIAIERMGPLETAIICKEGTNAPGIVAKIGPYLPDCKFSMLRPKIIKKWIKNIDNNNVST